MTSNDIIALMNQAPFSPFEIRLADGGRVRVDEPFQIATRRNSAICFVYESENTIRQIALRNITEIVSKPSPASPPQT